jgi:hypothetical protein
VSPCSCARAGVRSWCFLVKHDTSTDEIIARRVAGETLRDLRSVRKEMRRPGSVRGLAGEQIRAALTRHRRDDSVSPPSLG